MPIGRRTEASGFPDGVAQEGEHRAAVGVVGGVRDGDVAEPRGDPQAARVGRRVVSTGLSERIERLSRAPPITSTGAATRLIAATGEMRPGAMPSRGQDW